MGITFIYKKQTLDIGTLSLPVPSSSATTQDMVHCLFQFLLPPPHPPPPGAVGMQSHHWIPVPAPLSTDHIARDFICKASQVPPPPPPPMGLPLDLVHEVWILGHRMEFLLAQGRDNRTVRMEFPPLNSCSCAPVHRSCSLETSSVRY